MLRDSLIFLPGVGRTATNCVRRDDSFRSLAIAAGEPLHEFAGTFRVPA
jgi:hypothetical protein